MPARPWALPSCPVVPVLPEVLVLSASPTAPSGSRAKAARATMDALATSTDVFEDFFVSARIGLALADLNGSYVRVNMTYADLLGRSPEDLVGVPLADVLTGTGVVELDALLDGRQPALDSEQAYAHADGTSAWVLHGVAPVAGPDGRPAWFAVSAQDITERRRAEEDLRALTTVLTERAVRDPLTGLANRVLFEERLRGALSRDARNDTSTGVLFLDLDGFKEINDRYGHSVGDAVLQAVAERLTAGVRPADTVARLGGDEFVVLVEDTGEPGLQALADRLVDAVRQPLHVVGMTVHVGVSVGAAVARGGAADPAGLVAQADARMYSAKRSAR